MELSVLDLATDRPRELGKLAELSCWLTWNQGPGEVRDYWGLRVLRGLDSAASFVHRHVPGGEDAHRQPVCTSGGSSSTSRSLRNACAQQNAMKALSCPHYKRCAPSSLLSALSKVARGR